jgi:DNA-binding transcriptional regulator YhcF (GntR family)
MSRLQARAPRNTTTRAERLATWNAAHAAGLKFGPERVVGRDARYRWLDAILSSDLSRTTRLVAHSLARHGRVDGGNIFPSTRRLASESGLSERTVCTHLDLLVRQGFLRRQPRHGNTAGARGFQYLLNIPKVLKPLQRSDSVLKLVQHSAEARAASAERDDVER